MRNKKAFATLEILVVILIVVVTGGLFYVIGRNTSPVSPEVSSTPEVMVEDEMSGWETYTNEDLGVRFQYYPDLVLEEENTSTVSPTDKTPVEYVAEFSSHSYDPAMVFLVELNKTEISGEKIETKSIGEYEYQIYEGFYKNAPALYHSTIQRGNVYSIALVIQNSKSGEFILSDTIDQILSTFEFTNE